LILYLLIYKYFPLKQIRNKIFGEKTFFAELECPQ